mgnify:CR=1 FL=1
MEEGQHDKLYVQTAQQAYSTASMGKGKTARVCTLERNVHVIADSWTAGKGMCMCMCAVRSLPMRAWLLLKHFPMCAVRRQQMVLLHVCVLLPSSLMCKGV